MTQDHLKAALIKMQRAIKNALGLLIKPAMVLFSAVMQKAAAQHGRERQRDESGDQDGDADGDGKFVQQPSDDAAHENNGNEDGSERNGHRQNGAADFAYTIH